MRVMILRSARKKKSKKKIQHTLQKNTHFQQRGRALRRKLKNDIGKKGKKNNSRTLLPAEPQKHYAFARDRTADLSIVLLKVQISF
jgi:hypothetical protein